MLLRRGDLREVCAEEGPMQVWSVLRGEDVESASGVAAADLAGLIRLRCTAEGISA